MFAGKQQQASSRRAPASEQASKQSKKNQPATKQQASSSSSSNSSKQQIAVRPSKGKMWDKFSFKCTTLHNHLRLRLYILNYFESFWLPHSCFYNRCFKKKISRAFVQTLLVITILVCQILPVVSFLFCPIVDPMAQRVGRKSHQLGKSHQNIKIPMC